MTITKETTIEEIANKTKDTLYKMAEKEKEDDKNNTNSTGDFVRETMRIRCSRVPFSEHDFMRLFIATLSLHNQIILDVDNLGYKLYKYHDMEEYQFLLQDFAVKQQIEGSFFRVENAVQTASLVSLLSAHYITGSNRLINLRKDEAQEIVSSYDSETVNKMDSLTKDFIDCYDKPKQKVK